MKTIRVPKALLLKATYLPRMPFSLVCSGWTGAPVYLHRNILILITAVMC